MKKEELAGLAHHGIVCLSFPLPFPFGKGKRQTMEKTIGYALTAPNARLEREGEHKRA